MLDDSTRKKLLGRLRRIEGQIAGIHRMVEQDTYCVDVLVQMAAAQGALAKAGHLLLGHHVEHCVSDAMRHGDEDARRIKIDELMDVLGRYGGLGR
ncbi:MAG: metal-sensitive transcriptional regulator [Acidobacteriota bacterium]